MVKYVGLRSTVVFGGIDMKPQTAALRQGVEFLVATPGRLLDHVQQKTVKPAASRGFCARRSRPHARHGIHPGRASHHGRSLPKQRQNLLFSATLSADIRTLADSFLHDPVLVQVARLNTAAEFCAARSAPGPARAQARVACVSRAVARFAPGTGLHFNPHRRQPPRLPAQP